MSLFSPLTIRGTTFPNRLVISPMSQYRCRDGVANDWHLVHLGRFAMGGAGCVCAEATAVERQGLRTHGDLGLWSDAQIEPLARVARFLEAEGAVPAIQLGHAGRKASERRPWHTQTPVTEEDVALRGEAPWETIAPSPIPFAPEWPTPREMTIEDIQRVVGAFGAAAARAEAAGFRMIDVYAAHGFLLHQFYSPLANQRTDGYGGDLAGRMRMCLEVADSIRANVSDAIPLFFRISATDWIDGGWTLEESVTLARALKSRGVDVVDCSTGGIAGRDRPAKMPVGEAFQVPLAETIRREAEIQTMAVGFIWDPKVAEEAITEGRADLVAVARETLDDPNWPLKAAAALGADEDFEMWKPEFGWWLRGRAKLCRKLGIR